MNFDDNFWNIMFGKKLPKHKDRLDVIFVQSLLQTVNVKKSFCHVFNNLHNCLIYVTYIVDPKLLPRLPSVVDRT
jgi:hypothetical protein